MSYGLIYTIPFASLNNEACVVEIEKEGYSGKVTELIAGTSPFTVDIESEEFLYTPTRFSTATIRIVGGDYLRNLFSTAYQQYRVTFKKDGAITWCGFIKPELYTQDYNSGVFELELECISAMYSLEYIEYSITRETKKFVSLWNLLRRCINASFGQYDAVYIPYVYARSKEKYNSGSNVIDEMLVSEQNFFDEDDKPMKLKEVLDEICKFLGWTCVDWKGGLYFVDIDHIGGYHKYDIDLSKKIDVNFNSLTVQNMGFAGSEHSLDVLPGYNKVTVKCSNYPIPDILDFSVNYDELSTLSALPDLASGNNVSHRILLNPGKMQMYQYKEFAERVKDLDKYKNDPESDNLLGAIPMRYCNYKIENNVPSISDYNYTDAVRVRLKNKDGIGIGGSTPVFELKSPCVAYPPGVFCINASAKYFRNTELSPLSKDQWGGNLMIGFKLIVGEFDFTNDEPMIGESMFKCTYLNFGPYEDKDYKEAINDKKLTDPYTGASGKIINPGSAGGGVLAGGLRFQLLSSMYPSEVNKYGIFLQNLSVKFVPKDGEDTTTGSDRIYENVLNEDYINELDEIELKISSYNHDGACYSKILYSGFLSYMYDGYLTDNLYSAIEETNIRPEEQLIRRIIKRYSAPRIKLTQEIKETSDLTPISRLSDNSMVNSRFINAGGTIDYAMNQFQCIMIEV